jgi:Tol biopolymer transport system component
MATILALTGCGTDASSPLVTYVARASSDDAPHLFTLNETTQKSTAVAIPIPTNALYVAANGSATAVTYCYDGSNGYDIFYMGTDGKEKQLTTGADACESVFSPDGKTIAFVSGQSGDLQVFTMNVDGTNQKVLYAPPAGTLNQFYPEFAPDGKSIVFYVEMINGPGAGGHLGRSNRQGQSWPRAWSGLSKAAVHGSIHPEIATPSQNGWYTMALTDIAPTLVYATTSWWGPAVYSVDGKKILMTIYDGNKDNISSVNLDGTGLTPLTTSTVTDNFSPVPYKNVILFNAWNSDNSSWDIYVMDQTGANQTLVSSTTNTWETLLDSYWSGD